MSAAPKLPDRYQVLERLGAGGMGLVALAEDRELGRQVAVKVLRSGLPDEAIERFRREAQVMARIEHPNLIRLLDFGVVEGAPYMALEYFDGLDLDARRPEDPLGAMLQVAEGLQALHDAGILHRDIKPENIFVNREGRVVLADLGLAQPEDLDALTRTGCIVGTPYYMAPEMLLGEEQSTATDWYAWGLTLYELAEGREIDGLARRMAHQDGEPVAPLEFRPRPPEDPLPALVEACLAMDPGDRPRDLPALRRLVRPEGAPSPAVAAPAPPGRGGLVARGVAVLVVGLLAGVAWPGREIPPERPIPEPPIQAGTPPPGPAQAVGDPLALELEAALDGDLIDRYRQEGMWAYARLAACKQRLRQLAPAAPGDEESEHLRRLDARLGEVGMLPLFEPFLDGPRMSLAEPWEFLFQRLSARAARKRMTLDRREFLRQLGPDAAPVHVRAVEAGVAVLRAYEDLHDRLRHRRGLPAGLPASTISAFSLVGPEMALGSLQAERALRQPFDELLAPYTLAFRRLVVAAQRSLVAENSVHRARFLCRIIRVVDDSFLGSALSISPAFLFAMGPANPPGRYFRRSVHETLVDLRIGFREPTRRDPQQDADAWLELAELAMDRGWRDIQDAARVGARSALREAGQAARAEEVDAALKAWYEETAP